jgi:hypothetical protein
MALDEDAGNPVARRRADRSMESAMRMRAGLVVLGIAACGPAVHPVGPGIPEPSGPTAITPHGAGARSGAPARGPIGRGVFVGEMCPAGAAGRPGVVPMFVRTAEWKDDPDDVEEPLVRSAIRELAVVGEDGGRAGVFSVMGAADVGIGMDVAIGSYAGGSPCARPAQAGGKPADDPACVAATHGCALAIAPIAPGQDAYGGPAPQDLAEDVAAPPVGAACVAGDTLVVDIDGDGAAETYSLPAFLDPVRAPADEVSAVPTAAPACKGSFARWAARVDAGGEPGAGAPDPRYRVEIDLLGVADVDGDGRRELFLAFRYPDRRAVVVYSATSSAGRLEKVGEALPWQSTPSPRD